MARETGTHNRRHYAGRRTLTSTGGVPAVTLDKDICDEQGITKEDIGSLIHYEYDGETKILQIDLSRL